MNPLRWLRNAKRRKNDLHDELESHLKMAIAARVAEGDVCQAQETSQQQPRAHQQHTGQSNFRDHQQAAKPQAAVELRPIH